MTSSILAMAGLLFNGVSQVASTAINTVQTAALDKVSQNSYGDAVIMDLSPAAQAAVNGTAGTSTTAQNPVSNISSSIFSKMAQTYSAGNTSLDANNNFFDQLFAGMSSSSSGSSSSSSTSSNSAGTQANDSTETLLSAIV